MQVSGVDIEVTTRLRQWLLIEIERHVRGKTCHASDGRCRRRGREAANIDRVLTRTRTTGGNARQLDEVIIEVFDTELLKLLLTDRFDSNRDALRALGSP